LSGPTKVSGDADFTHSRWVGRDGELFELFEHRYEMSRGGGHCVPGSTAVTTQYPYGCQGPNAFNWGEEVMRFFKANPLP